MVARDFKSYFFLMVLGADRLEEGFLNKQAGRMLADFAVALVVSKMLLFIFDVGSGRQLGEGSPLSARQLLHNTIRGVYLTEL